MNKTLIWVIVIVIVIVGGYYLFFQGAPAGEGEVIKIGFIGPLTGEAASYGEPLRNTIALAVEEVNAAGGINGQLLEIIYEDAKCTGKDAANAAQKLVNVDKVKVIIGGFCSSESLAAEPIATGAKVLLFSAGSSSPDLTGKSQFFVRNYPSDASQGAVLAELANKRGWKKVAFLVESKDYPQGIYKAFKTTFDGFGGVIIKEEFPPEASDFKTQLAKLKVEKPDALFLSVQTPAPAERIFKQLGELNWKPPLLVADVIVGDPKIVETHKAILEGAIGAEFGIDPGNEKFQHLIQTYKEKYGADTPYQAYAQTEYDAVFMIGDGIKAVGYDGEKLAKWLREIADWRGASGIVDIKDDGDRAGGHIPKIVKNGKVEIYQQ